MIRVLGIDPGASAAFALVEAEERGRPRLLWHANVWGTGEAWWNRLNGAVAELPAPLDLVLIEVPGGGSRSRRGTRGPATWGGHGAYRGQIVAVLRMHPQSLQPETIGSDEWPKLLGVRVGKDRGTILAGEHRLREAALYVEAMPPAEGWDSAADAERAVAVAEAALIACAGVVRLRAGGTQ